MDPSGNALMKGTAGGHGTAGEATLRRYVLGLLSEAEEDTVALRSLEGGYDADWLAAVADELIEDYLLGRLDPDERAAFRRQVDAGAIQADRIRLIRGLLALGRGRGRSRSLAMAAGLAATLVAAAGLWLEPVPLSTRSESTTAVVLDLSATGMRSGPIHLATARLDSRSLCLRLRLPADREALPAALLLELVSPEGLVLESSVLQRPHPGERLEWDVAAGDLEPGAYVVAVRDSTSREPLASFPFAVERVQPGGP